MLVPASPLYLIDSNILVHYVRGDELGRRIEARYALMSAATRSLISVVSIGEMHSLARRWSRGAGKVERMEALLTRTVPVSLGFAGVLDAYAELDDYSRRKGIAMSKNDVWIAATARAAGAHLLTTDRDFDHLSPDFLTRDWINPVT